MNFWKKLFAGMGFVCGFLVFETMSLAYHNSGRRHKNHKGRYRCNSFWDAYPVHDLCVDLRWCEEKPGTGGQAVLPPHRERVPTVLRFRHKKQSL